MLIILLLIAKPKFFFSFSLASLLQAYIRSSVDVASKPYFLAGSNRKQIAFDRTSTERLVDTINDPLENIFSTPLIAFFSRSSARRSHLSFYLSAEKPKQNWLTVASCLRSSLQQFVDGCRQHFFPHLFPQILFGHRDRATVRYKDVHTSLLFVISVNLPTSFNTYSAQNSER